MKEDDGDGLVILDPISDKRKKEENIDSLVRMDPEKKSVLGDIFRFDITHPIDKLKEAGQEGKEILGGFLESEPARMLRSAGGLGQEGLLGLAHLLTGHDFSKYRNVGGDPLTHEERKSPEATFGRVAGDVAGAFALPMSIESGLEHVLPSISAGLREAGALGGAGAISGAYEHPDHPLEEGQLGAIENLATLGGAKLLGGLARGAKHFYRSFAKQTPKKIESFLEGAFRDPYSPASQLIKSSYGSPAAESESLQRAIGESYQNNALEAGKHINDEGIIRPLSRGIGSEERNPVYNSLERRLKSLDETKSGVSLDKTPYNEAIEKAQKGLSQTTRQALPVEFLDKNESLSSPLEAFKRYRQLNRRVLNRPHGDPDLVRAATDLKKGIMNQLEEGASRNENLRNWLNDFKKANKGFARSSKYEKRYKDIEDTIGGVAPKDVADRLLKMIDQNPESLKTALKDFGDIRNPLKNALLHKKIGKDTLSYHPMYALEAFESLSSPVRKVLFDKPELDFLNKLSEAKEKIGTMATKTRHDFGSHAAHALGLTGEALGVPFSHGAAIPWLSRIAEEMSHKRAFESGRSASLKDIENILEEEKKIKPRESGRTHSRIPFLSSIIANLISDSQDEDKK